ncbi:MAG: hypothetical protein Q4C55_09805 [Eubacterium sp.]|nr:hypothetical protein [Eubacterium sp.]
MMNFKFRAEINGRAADIEFSLAELTPQDAEKKSPIRGYKCETVCIDGQPLKNPAFVSGYAETFKKTGPALCFKFGAARELEEKFGSADGRKGLPLYVLIPEAYKKSYLEVMSAMDDALAALEARAEAQRNYNDAHVKDDDIIEISYSPRFVGVRYPFESNREKEESKIWSSFDGSVDLDDWIEIHLEPYCTGIGCGSSKKYRIPYKEYAALLKDYQAQLDQKGF